MRASIFVSLILTLLVSNGICQTNDTSTDSLHICFTGSVPCGITCCITTLIPSRRSFCADPTISLCCPVGMHNANGICCPLLQTNCGGKCCNGRCVLEPLFTRRDVKTPPQVRERSCIPGTDGCGPIRPPPRHPVCLPFLLGPLNTTDLNTTDATDAPES
jgi:hypothetical protein